MNSENYELRSSSETDAEFLSSDDHWHLLSDCGMTPPERVTPNAALTQGDDRLSEVELVLARFQLHDASEARGYQFATERERNEYIAQADRSSEQLTERLRTAATDIATRIADGTADDAIRSLYREALDGNFGFRGAERLTEVINAELADRGEGQPAHALTYDDGYSSGGKPRAESVTRRGIDGSVAYIGVSRTPPRRPVAPVQHLSGPKGGK